MKAVVRPADPAACPALADALITCCRTHLAGYECPRTIEFTDELPCTPTGELLRRLLTADRPATS